MLSKRVNSTSQWTQTDSRPAWCYDVSSDMREEEERERDSLEEYLDAEQAELEDAASFRQQRCFEREDRRFEEQLSNQRAVVAERSFNQRTVVAERSSNQRTVVAERSSNQRAVVAERSSNQRAVVAERSSNQRAVARCPSNENIRPIYRSNLERRMLPAQPTIRRPMSLDREPSRATQSRIPRARSASETSQVSRDETRSERSVAHSNRRPLRSPNRMHVHFECTPPAVAEEQDGDEESDEVFLASGSPTTPETWRDRNVAPKSLVLRTQSEQMHRVVRETKQRVAGNVVPSRKYVNTSNNGSISATHKNESSNHAMSNGRSNTSPKHDFPSPYSYEQLMISANSEQKTPDSGYLSPQESRSSPNERDRSTPARNPHQRTRSMSVESGVRATGLPRRTASSTNQLQAYWSQMTPKRSSGNNGHVREKHLSGVTTPSGRRTTSSPSGRSEGPRTATVPVKDVNGQRPTQSDWSPRCSIRSASVPPTEPFLTEGCDGGGAGDVIDTMQPIDVRLSESFFENEQDAAGHWLCTGEGLLSPAELGLWPHSETNASPSSHPENEKHPDELPSATDSIGRNSDYISSLMQRELDRSCTPTEPKKYFDLAPTYKKWLYDYSRTDSLSGATSARRRDVSERPVKSASRLPHRIATYRRMAAHSEKTAVH